jgi:hypothetical protein
MNAEEIMAEMALEAAQEGEIERIARRTMEERLASVERKLEAILELLGKQATASKGNGLKSSKQRFSITVTGRDSAERIETFEIS